MKPAELNRAEGKAKRLFMALYEIVNDEENQAVRDWAFELTIAKLDGIGMETTKEHIAALYKAVRL